MDGRLTDPYASVALLATGTLAQTKELAGALVPVVSAVFLYLIMTIVAPWPYCLKEAS